MAGGSRRVSEKLGLVACFYDFDWASAHFVYGEEETGVATLGMVGSLTAFDVHHCVLGELVHSDHYTRS
jgi:hypothetical protein